MIIDESSTWDFFDKAFQGNPGLRGAEEAVLLKASNLLNFQLDWIMEQIIGQN